VLRVEVTVDVVQAKHLAHTHTARNAHGGPRKDEVLALPACEKHPCLRMSDRYVMFAVALKIE
jgi:hypothetical protein